jgi:hypothetical protein
VEYGNKPIGDYIYDTYERIGNDGWIFTQTKTEAIRAGVKAIPAILKGAILPIGNSFLKGTW